MQRRRRLLRLACHAQGRRRGQAPPRTTKDPQAGQGARAEDNKSSTCTLSRLRLGWAAAGTHGMHGNKFKGKRRGATPSANVRQSAHAWKPGGRHMARLTPRQGTSKINHHKLCRALAREHNQGPCSQACCSILLPRTSITPRGALAGAASTLMVLLVYLKSAWQRGAKARRVTSNMPCHASHKRDAACLLGFLTG